MPDEPEFMAGNRPVDQPINVRREIQLLIDFLCHSAGGPLLYTGRDMKISHKGMRITEEDWAADQDHGL